MRTHFFDRLDEKPDPEKLNDPANVANTIVFILSQPPESNIGEIIITPFNETSWP
jgi:NADP-dependent 3-hydroxy acid dehydrogenase YdfG